MTSRIRWAGVLRSVSVVTSALLLAQPAGAQATRVLRGRILLSPDSLPLPSVYLRVLGTERTAFSDGRGRFEITGVPAGPVRLAFRRVGIRADTVDVPATQDTLTILARGASLLLDPVIVVGEASPARDRFESLAQTSTVSLEPREITQTPGLFEADIVRVVQLLPGTVAKNDYSISYNVRGGEADQNLIQLDGITVFNPSHLAGLFSTFDANAVSRADFLTGGFPARYSGRLSSVLDIQLRTGSPDRTAVSGQVSLLSSKVLVEGPVGRATYLVGARRTYADALVSAFSNEVLPYYFSDAIGKVTYPYGNGASISATAYWGRDVLDFELVSARPGRDQVRLAFDWGNRLAGVTWRHGLGRATWEHRISVSEFSTTLGLLPNLARFDNDARLLTARSAVTVPVSRHRLESGISLESYRMNYQISSATLETTFFRARYTPTILSGFLDDQWRVTDGIMIRPGLRVEHVGGADFTGLSPRIALKAFLGGQDAITASAGRYHQAIHSIRDQEFPITIFEFWVGADQNIPVARSDHLVLGYERWFGRDVQVSVEGYRKTFVNLVTPNRAQDLRVVGDEFIPASGDAWGVDVLVRRHVGTIRGWIAYGFTKTIRRSQGVEFPPSHDRRHTVNVVLLTSGPLGSLMGVRWGLGSPLPYTGFIGEWDHRRYSATSHTFDDFEREPISTEINGERYPTYSRLDVSFRWDFEKFGIRWEPYLQVANAYNRQNVFLYFFDFVDAPPTRTGVSQLPFLPSIGVEFSF